MSLRNISTREEELEDAIRRIARAKDQFEQSDAIHRAKELLGESARSVLLSLEEFNRLGPYIVSDGQNGNGIECPKCSNEMCDSDPFTLLSSPAKRNVHCEKCGHRDFRKLLET